MYMYMYTIHLIWYVSVSYGVPRQVREMESMLIVAGLVNLVVGEALDVGTAEVPPGSQRYSGLPYMCVVCTCTCTYNVHVHLLHVQVDARVHVHMYMYIVYLLITTTHGKLIR